MRRLTYLLQILVLLSLVNIGCKKGSDDDITTNCSTSKFQVTINEFNFWSESISEDNEGNIIILGKDTVQVKLIKLNSVGELIWNMPVSNEMIPVDLMTLNDNSVLVLLKGPSFKEYCDFQITEDVYIQNGIWSSMNCIPTYELGVPVCYTYKAELKLLKFDINGNQVWAKTFDDSYAGGKSLIANTNNSFLLMSAQASGRQPELVGIDTVNYPLDKNTVNIYKMSYDGEIIWENKLKDIWNNSWTDDFSPSIEITKLSDQIVIKTKRNIITTDIMGTEIERTETHPDHCDNIIHSMIGIADNSYLISGRYNIYSDLEVVVNYTQLIDLNGEIIWKKDELFNLKEGNANSFITNRYQDIKYYNINGDLQWTHHNVNTKCVIMNCNNGITYANTINNYLVVTRTDGSGNFE